MGFRSRPWLYGSWRSRRTLAQHNQRLQERRNLSKPSSDLFVERAIDKLDWPEEHLMEEAKIKYLQDLWSSMDERDRRRYIPTILADENGKFIAII